MRKLLAISSAISAILFATNVQAEELSQKSWQEIEAQAKK